MRYTSVVVGLFALFSILSLAGAPPGDGDQFWQRWLGERILTEHRIPAQIGPESFIANGKPWVAQEWAFGVFLALTYDHGWFSAAGILMGLVPALALIVTAKRLERRGVGDLPAAIIIAFVAVTCMQMFGMRAQFLGWPLLAAVLLAIETGGLWIWCAVPVTAVWANLHASAVLVPVIFLSEAAGALLERPAAPRESLRAFGIFIASALAVCATPLGVRLPEYAVALALSPIRNFITEWQAPALDSLSFSVGVLGIVVIAAFAGLERGPRTVRERLLLAMFFCLTLSAVRNMAQFIIVCAPFVAVPLSNSIRGIVRPPDVARRRTRFDFVMRVVIVLVGGVEIVFAQHKNALAAPPAEAAMPYHAAAALMRLPGNHRLMCEQAQWCSLFVPSPRVSVYMDARFDPYPLAMWQVNRGIAALNPGWYPALQSLRVDSVVTTHDSPLVDALRARGWRVAYRDKYYWLLVTRGTHGA